MAAVADVPSAADLPPVEVPPVRPRSGSGRWWLRVGPVSVPVDRRALLVSLALAAVVLVGMVWSVSSGEVAIPFGEVVGQVTGLSPARNTFIVRTLRLPRVLTGVLVGAAFGVSGQIFQRLVRNPLASPDILGVSSGAAAAAVFGIVALGASTATTTSFGLVGSVLTVGAIYVLAIKQGLSSYRLVLVGIGMTAVLDAVVAYLIARAEMREAQQAVVWLTGSLNGRGWEYVVPLSAALAVVVPATLVTARSLRALELGDEGATGLGVGVRRSKLMLSLAGAALAALATAAAGPVGFVALISPQIARRLTGNGTLGLVPAGLVGAALVTYADLAARRLFHPVELPVGLITAIIGAPVLLWLLARANRIGSGG